jgi:hypothetical protein
MNSPWSFYEMEKTYLLEGRPFDSLAACAKAIQLSTAEWMIDTSLRSLEEIAVDKDQLQGYAWVQMLLILGLAAKFPSRENIERVRKLTTRLRKPITNPVIIVAGGNDFEIEEQLQNYRQLMLKAFSHFQGTVVSGGTTAGTSGFVGELGEVYAGAIRTIGYIPNNLPGNILQDTRYAEIQRTEGNDFSPLEPLQYWIDIISSGISSYQVKLLGVNGGPIASIEYKIALALGAHVAVLEGSGGEVDKLITDNDWANSKTLMSLPADAMMIGAFVGGASPQLNPEIREIIAQAIHENYRQGKTRISNADDPTSSHWAKLTNNLKESNLQQTDSIANKLSRIGNTVVKATSHKTVEMTFTEDEIEVMAEMEHARWTIERLLDGWRPGKNRDVDNKISPYLVPWAKLPEDAKEWDRETVRQIPGLLAQVGLEIHQA